MTAKIRMSPLSSSPLAIDQVANAGYSSRYGHTHTYGPNAHWSNVAMALMVLFMVQNMVT